MNTYIMTAGGTDTVIIEGEAIESAFDQAVRYLEEQCGGYLADDRPYGGTCRHLTWTDNNGGYLDYEITEGVRI
jgi:hypothetical protein